MILKTLYVLKSKGLTAGCAGVVSILKCAVSAVWEGSCRGHFYLVQIDYANEQSSYTSQEISKSNLHDFIDNSIHDGP